MADYNWPQYLVGSREEVGRVREGCSVGNPGGLSGRGGLCSTGVAYL